MSAPEFHGSLEQADWPRREGMQILTRALGAENIRWVGGAVRDTLLGVSVHDVDCATTHPPDEVMDRCAVAGIRTVPTGIDHGTITAVLEDGPVEITTLRHDVSTDGRRATVTFATEWREDAARRDFTINALFAHPESLEISDYFGGLDDLAARRVRFIGDAKQRIAEDHLRILRYYRFQARFGAELDTEAEEACAQLAGTLKGLSRERVADELIKLLALPDPGETVERMFNHAVLRVVLPEASLRNVELMRELIVHEKREDVAADPLRRLAALLPPSPDVAADVSARLRLSRAQRNVLVAVAGRFATDVDHPQALAYFEGNAVALHRLLLAGGDTKAICDWDAPTLPLKGGTIVDRGVAAGPEVARILKTVERRWVEEGFPDENRVEQILTEELTPT
ncbi:CCA tRNA nucleotidyltransferase [Erythrobacter crassostreae]|uniref:CCA tRNA nucleotidyltransferase n=1 Tax=Erythrobacter crassostreae TaxID=2828328 RepID=A0A9X1F3L4_9SPHN|nr:CCA tRNA nucleotidyltransferase [Erythrobacter crassostrea]MBV7259442.1 CCA tRNA nucleotidyltransferase [Erythrobacter crassostrea]